MEGYGYGTLVSEMVLEGHHLNLPYKFYFARYANIGNRLCRFYWLFSHTAP